MDLFRARVSLVTKRVEKTPNDEHKLPDSASQRSHAALAATAKLLHKDDREAVVTRILQTELERKTTKDERRETKEERRKKKKKTERI